MQLSPISLALTRLGGVPFSPATLFAAGGEQGAWYDPSDLTTLFQDSAGTTPVTAVEQPVGLMLDKSGRGNHAFQTTSASRPTLSARVNLLTKTEQFDDAVWVKSAATITANTTATTDPLGGNTADKLVENSANTSHLIYSTVTSVLVPAAGVTFTVYAKAAERSWMVIDAYIGNDEVVYFDLANGALGTVGANCTATITAVGNGWYRCSVTRTKAAGTYNLQHIVASATANNTSSYLGDGTSGIYIWGADLRVANDGVGIPAYQRVNTSTDYDTSGFPIFLSAPGTRAMVTNSINPGAVDKAQVFAGVRKLVAGTGQLVELSAAVFANNGVFSMPSDSGTNNWGTSAKGTSTAALAESATNSYTAPVTTVNGGIYDLSLASNIATLRINGAQIVQSGAGAGGGNFGTYPLNLFARNNGASIPLNGRCYSMIVRFGDNLSAAQIASTESWVNGKTKAY